MLFIKEYIYFIKNNMKILYTFMFKNVWILRDIILFRLILITFVIYNVCELLSKNV